MENKECLFYIDHNPPECSGTWGGAIHKGACKLNSTDCKDTDGCFIKNLYNKLKIKEQKCKKLKQKCKKLKFELEQQKALTETYEVCYRAKHNDIDGKLFKYKQTLNKIEKYIKDVICKEECNYNWEKPCSDCDCRYNDILDIINNKVRGTNES